MGPPRYLPCFRFEAKHKILKLASKSFTSRVDPAKSIAIKYQLQLNYRFLISEFFNSRVKYGKVLGTDEKLLDDYYFFKSKLKNDFACEHYIVSWVSINRTMYLPDSIITTNVANDKINFNQIKYIIVDAKDNSNVLFVCNEYKIVSYLDHFGACEVKSINSYESYTYMQLSFYYFAYNYTNCIIPKCIFLVK